MKQVHITLQGKGGIGKSYVSSLVAQNILDKKEPLICFDTDPINATLSGFKTLNVRTLDLMVDNRVNEGRFDEMVEIIHNEDSHFVVDTGAASFVPLSNYIVQHEVLKMISESGKQPIIHTVIAGGFALKNTLSDFATIAEQMNEQLPGEANIVVWLNEQFGKIENNGKTFEESKAYQAHKDKVISIVKLPRLNEDTYGKTIEELITNRHTFAEAMDSTTYRLMAKQRIKVYSRGVYEQMRGIC